MNAPAELSSRLCRMMLVVCLNITTNISAGAQAPSASASQLVATGRAVANVAAAPAVADPTVPSPSIHKLLGLAQRAAAPSQAGADVTSKEKPQIHLRLKGIVLRDRHHGTALISVNGGDVLVVRLRRADLETTPIRLPITGLQMFVEDFDDSSILLRCPSTRQQYLVR